MTGRPATDDPADAGGECGSKIGGNKIGGSKIGGAEIGGFKASWPWAILPEGIRTKGM